MHPACKLCAMAHHLCVVKLPIGQGIYGLRILTRQIESLGALKTAASNQLHALRYGMYRAQVLGLEAVLADGSVLTSLKGLPKDNSGYDLSQLFIGTEGTLGVVTRAALRLHPKPASEVNAFCALPSLDAAIAFDASKVAAHGRGHLQECRNCSASKRSRPKNRSG